MPDLVGPFRNDPDEIVNTNILSYYSNKVTMNGL